MTTKMEPDEAERELEVSLEPWQKGMLRAVSEATVDDYADYIFQIAFIGQHNGRPWFLYKNGQSRHILTAEELEDSKTVLVQTPDGKAIEMTLTMRDNAYMRGNAIDPHDLEARAKEREEARSRQREESREEARRSRHGETT